MIIKYFKDYVGMLNEGLIRTYPIDKVVKNINNTLPLMIGSEIKHIDNKVVINLFDINSVSSKKLNLIFNHISSMVINMGGYFPSKMNVTNIHGMSRLIKYDIDDILRNHSYYECVEITYEAKFDEPINEEIINKIDKLYHLTINEYSGKIRKYGLIPKSKNKLTKHLDRIYLCETIEDCKNLINQMYFHYANEEDMEIYKNGNKEWKKDIQPVIYEINNKDNIPSQYINEINF
jgi:hypothetical protein